MLLVSISIISFSALLCLPVVVYQVEIIHFCNFGIAKPFFILSLGQKEKVI